MLSVMSECYVVHGVGCRSGQSELSPQECVQLLSRATQVFREEYIQKLDLAREVIEKR